MMKKIIYLCLLALLAVSFGCSKDEIFVEDQNRNSESTELVNGLEKGKFNQETNTTTGQENYARSTDEPLSIHDEYGIPYGTNLLALYLDMNLLQLNYSGSYTGSFSDHYKNEMSAHFTIYAVQDAHSSCGNIERWIVNKEEYNLYSGGSDDDGVIIIAIDTDGGNNSSTSSGSGSNSNTTGWGNDSGDVTTTPKKKKSDDDDDDEPMNGVSSIGVPTNYEGCF